MYCEDVQRCTSTSCLAGLACQFPVKGSIIQPKSYIDTFVYVEPSSSTATSNFKSCAPTPYCPRPISTGPSLSRWHNTVLGIH